MKGNKDLRYFVGEVAGECVALVESATRRGGFEIVGKFPDRSLARLVVGLLNEREAKLAKTAKPKPAPAAGGRMSFRNR